LSHNNKYIILYNRNFVHCTVIWIR